MTRTPRDIRPQATAAATDNTGTATQSTPTMFAPYRSAASSYRNLAIETAVMDASPHKLISMLFAGAIESIAKAKKAITQRDYEAKGRAIGKALRIVEEGLKASLDARGGAITENLTMLYDYMIQRLLQANIRSDEAMLDEVTGLLRQLQEAWDAIDPRHHRVTEPVAS